ncbi:hypothetical protein I302_102110 [Kwoniella bestiolae CBS 10118]|uniref:Uncharacterized protein n=1 Tax=Kwoniella bestiolae CBS 10118 TaxID=1296100 RepID=A0A1B9GE64_9TREE|nr:hypothetical protein I302_00798 [Kwoniella bestiolae CBS 10118]OCF29298.1 hypothetical protein I302_00798 [Kwoniella bestiolae CBS 10118]
MSGGIGLGLGFTSIDFEHPSSTISKSNDTPSIPAKPTHPAYNVALPERSHKGPRSLGVGKRFVSAPSQTLPPSIYDKTSSNPLSIPVPSPDTQNNMLVNSPQLGLDLVNINPTQHLRLMKKRSYIHQTSGNKRNFGLSSNDPLNRMSNVPIASSSSPTIGSSPTLGSSSPIMSSSPIPSQSQDHHVDMLGPSIALSVVLGLLVLGVASWVGIHYRRKRLSLQQEEEGYTRREKDSDEKSFTSEMFNASNVVEKGLRPNPSGNGNNHGEELRSSFISYKRPLSAVQPSGRRVSFVDTIHDDLQDEDECSHRNRRESILPPPRFMIASIHQPEAQSEQEEEEMDQPDPSPRTSIAPTLEMIEEETENETEEESLSEPSVLDSGPELEERERRDSIVSSTSSSSNSSTCSADYTTASARSSISSLSALSIISSSFPQTPRDQSTPPPQSPSPVQMDSEHDAIGPYDSPTPAGKFQSRRKRAQSHGPGLGLVEVQKHDLLRTAVGRTMSLQPTREVREFIRLMTSQNEPLPSSVLVSTEPSIAKSKASREIEDNQRNMTTKVEQVKRQDEMEDLRIAAFISSQLEEKVTREQEESQKKIMARSTSFPSKLLSRKKSSKNTGGSPGSRESEIISGSNGSNGSNYLKRALRAFNTTTQEDLPVPVPVIPTEIPNKQDAESIKILAERQAQLERYLSLIQSEGRSGTAHSSTEDSERLHHQTEEEEEGEGDPYMSAEQENGEQEEIDMEIEEEEEVEEVDSVWDPEAYAQEMELEDEGIAFEDYYIYFEGHEEYHHQEEGEEEDEVDWTMRGSGRREMDRNSGVPHIRVTSH